MKRGDLGARMRRVGAGLWRGRATDPAWVRPALVTLLTGTALLYLLGLGASGWANAYYSAAVQAGATSWKAFFFGSFDAANFITVDKPPASLWVMELSARAFGVNPWSILVPQALEGVASVGLLYLTVRRWFKPAAGLIAGLVFAITPVAVLMFRYNNPDALLVLLLVAAAYAVTRAIEGGRAGWLLLAGALVGTGFLTKMLQAYLVVPGFAAVYLLAGAPPFGKRLRQLLWAGAAMFLASSWWVAMVELTPASDRPYIGGSQNNSLLNLIFGYNGLGRINGNEAGSVGGGAPAGIAGGVNGGAGGGPGGMWGSTGWDRLFGEDMGTQISWLLPAALILLVALLWLTRRRPRTDRLRAGALLWGSWLLVTGLVFSFAAGIIHGYYTVALAPAIAALVGIGVSELWERRAALEARIVLAATVVVSGVWAAVLLSRTPSWLPALGPIVIVAAVVTAVLTIGGSWLSPRVVTAAVGGGLAATLLAPAAYATATADTTHSGGIVAAGPTGGAMAGGRPGQGLRGGAGLPPLGATGSGLGNGRPPTMPGGGPGFGASPPGLSVGPGAGSGAGLAGGRAGGLLEGSRPSAAMTNLLAADADSFTWIAATVGANQGAGYQLATGRPVMAIGGFNGTDPAPSLAQFQQQVAAGKIHYFIGDGSGRGTGTGGSSSGTGERTSAEISTWVRTHFVAQTVDGITVYDLTQLTGA